MLNAGSCGAGPVFVDILRDPSDIPGTAGLICYQAVQKTTWLMRVCRMQAEEAQRAIWYAQHDAQTAAANAKQPGSRAVQSGADARLQVMRQLEVAAETGSPAAWEQLAGWPALPQGAQAAVNTIRKIQAAGQAQRAAAEAEHRARAACQLAQQKVAGSSGGPQQFRQPQQPAGKKGAKGLQQKQRKQVCCGHALQVLHVWLSMVQGSCSIFPRATQEMWLGNTQLCMYAFPSLAVRSCSVQCQKDPVVKA